MEGESEVVDDSCPQMRVEGERLSRSQRQFLERQPRLWRQDKRPYLLQVRLREKEGVDHVSDFGTGLRRDGCVVRRERNLVRCERGAVAEALPVRCLGFNVSEEGSCDALEQSVEFAFLRSRWGGISGFNLADRVARAGRLGDRP